MMLCQLPLLLVALTTSDNPNFNPVRVPNNHTEIEKLKDPFLDEMAALTQTDTFNEWCRQSRLGTCAVQLIATPDDVIVSCVYVTEPKLRKPQRNGHK